MTKKTIKADFVENQLTQIQKNNLLFLTKKYFPEIIKFTMTTHLNIIVTLRNGDKVLYGHWFQFAFKKLLPTIVGSKYSNTANILQNILHGENIIDVLQKYDNTFKS